MARHTRSTRKKSLKVYSADELEQQKISLRKFRNLTRSPDVAIVPEEGWYWVLAALLRGAMLEEPGFNAKQFLKAADTEIDFYDT